MQMARHRCLAGIEGICSGGALAGFPSVFDHGGAAINFLIDEARHSFLPESEVVTLAALTLHRRTTEAVKSEIAVLTAKLKRLTTIG